MSMLRLAVPGLILYSIICLCSVPPVAAMPPETIVTVESQTDAKIVVAASDLSGADRELGKFLTDTLITDLSRSTVLQPLERATVQECCTKLELTSDKALSAAEVRKLGAATAADRVLVGTFMQRDGLLIINARVLDAHTGLVIPGGAMSVTGSRTDYLNVTHKLARQLHKRITDTELVIEDSPPGETPAPHDPGASDAPPTVHPVQAPDDLQILKSQGLIPAAAHANAFLTDADLATLVKNVSKCVTLQSETASTLSQTSGPVTRIRVLAGLLKLIVAPDDLANYKTAQPNHMPSDAAQLPSWGEPFLAAAVDQEWWPSDRQICGKDLATWAFVATLLTRLPLHQTMVHVDVPKTADPPAVTSAPDGDSEPYTGLVIDALDFKVERAMGPRIVDEAGHVIYPDPGHVPSDEYVQDKGMVSYYSELSEAKRAGRHPLVIHATKVSELGHDDITVSNEAGELIREANRRGKFLWKWCVAVLAGKGKQVSADMPAPPAQ